MCEIEINPERLKHFPKTVPMNIREAVLITAQALKRIYEAAHQKTEVAGEKPQEPASAQEAVLPPRNRRGRSHRTSQKKGIHSRTRTIYFSES
jgi:hypothetical protein